MKNPYMKLWIGDYLADTAHLTAEQHGAYLLLLMAMFANAKKTGGGITTVLPKNPSQLSQICCMSLKRWNVVSTTVLKFFDEKDGMLTHKRVQSELDKVFRTGERQRKNVSARWLKNKDMADTMVIPDRYPHSHSHKKDTKLVTKKEDTTLLKTSLQSRAREELMRVLDEEHALAVIDHRRRLRAPLGTRAAKMLADHLREFPDPNQAADTMMERGWRSIRKDWEPNGHASKSVRVSPFMEAARERMRRIADDNKPS